METAGFWTSGCLPLSIYFIWVLEDAFNTGPRIVLQLLKETTVATGMTGDATLLIDAQQHNVVITIQAYVFYHLLVPRLFTLVP